MSKMYNLLKNNFLTTHKIIDPELLLKAGKLEELKRLDLAGEINLRSWKDPKTLRTFLHIASEWSIIEAIKYLAPASQINAQDYQGNTALHGAVQNLHQEAINVLFENNADITIANSRNQLPLHAALKQTSGKALAVLKLFTDHPVFKQLLVDEDCMYLCFSVVTEHDNVQALQLLCDKMKEFRTPSCTFQSFLSKKDTNGVTLVHSAARVGSHNVMKYLFHLATDIGLSHDDLTKAISYEKRTPLHYAVENDHLESVRVLLEHGANSTSLNGSHSPPVHRACRKDTLHMLKLMVSISGNEILQACDKEGRNAYHSSALSTCSGDMITYLVENGVPVDAEDYHSFSPLAHAILLGATAAIRSLLQNGANPMATSLHGYNALHLAISTKRYNIFEIVMASNKAMNMLEARSINGLLPIHYALKIGHTEMLNRLLPLMKTDMRDEEGNNYVHNAILSNNSKTLPYILRCLFAYKMTNEPNQDGFTPLHYAASQTNPTAAKLLIDKGAIIHKCNKGLTPFMFACSQGNYETAKVLYDQNKLQRNWTDHRGNTALHFAVDGNNHNIITFCLNKGTQVTLNDDGNSFFDKIIGKKDQQLAEAVFHHKRWEECLDIASPKKRHPLIRVLEEIPEAYGVLLDSCFSKSNHDSTHYDYWEEYNFKSVTLSSHWRYKQKNDHNGGIKDDFEMSTLLGERIVQEDVIQSETRDVKGEQGDNCKCFVDRDKRPLAVIRKLVYSKQQLYLLHPVVEAFITTRWNGVHGGFYLVKIILHFLLALLFTISLITSPLQFQQLPINNTSLSQNSSTVPSNERLFLLVVISMVVIMSTFIFIIEIIHRYNNITEVFKEVVAWMNFTALLLTSVYIGTILTNTINLKVWNTTAVAVGFTWLSVGLDLQIINTFNIGVYITILMSTSRIIFFTSLIAIIDVSKVIELEQSGNLQSSTLVFTLLIVILVLLPIITINVLIGLAVGNIEEIQKNAVLKRKSVEVCALAHLDFIELPCLSRGSSQATHRYYPNRRKSIWQWITYHLYHYKEHKLYAEESEKPLNTMMRQIMAEEMEAQSKRMDTFMKNFEDVLIELVPKTELTQTDSVTAN